jgi:hypothetical protein
MASHAAVIGAKEICTKPLAVDAAEAWALFCGSDRSKGSFMTQTAKANNSESAAALF